jgi:hypothetical protein
MTRTDRPSDPLSIQMFGAMQFHPGDAVLRYIEQAVAAEREACAKIVEDAATALNYTSDRKWYADAISKDFAALIRHRPLVL